MTWSVTHGDSLDVLREMPSDSIDAVVTDPPAGISFMQGRTGWDSDKGGRDKWIAWLAEIMSECLRVLKPGGHALVWALPRTSPWTGMAVENAGFEVRDVVQAHFGSGFPKSRNVGKDIDKVRHDTGAVRVICRVVRGAMDAVGVTAKEIAARWGFNARMVDHWAARDTDSQPTLPTWQQWRALRVMLSIGPEHDAEVWRLNQRKGERGEAWKRAEILGEHGGAAPGLVGRRFSAEDNLLRAPETDAAKQWEGFGTALKPSTEFWFLCRKPLEGTVAASVLKHGTGALNIAACRVGSEGGGTHCDHRDDSGKCLGHNNAGRSTSGETFHGPDTDGGRWPPHLLLQHSESCIRVGVRKVKRQHVDATANVIKSGFGTMQGSRSAGASIETIPAYDCAPSCPIKVLGEQSGEGKDGVAVRHRAGGNTFGGSNAKPPMDDLGYGAGGTAARFFPNLDPDSRDNGDPLWRYIAKPSTAEKNAGLGEWPELSGGEATGREDGSAGIGPRAGAGRTGGSRCPHPTVKSISLMRWLIRLITPPGGTVLDPFCGSGTTGCAAVLEGFSFIGIDEDETFCRLSRDRIEFWDGVDQYKVTGPDGTETRTPTRTERDDMAAQGDMFT